VCGRGVVVRHHRDRKAPMAATRTVTAGPLVALADTAVRRTAHTGPQTHSVGLGDGTSLAATSATGPGVYVM
jgi:hypothetical protein